MTVCFFVLCKTTLDQQGPGGAPWGFPVYTLRLNSDAGYAVLPLTLLGAPVNIGEARDLRNNDVTLTGMSRPWDVTLASLQDSRRAPRRKLVAAQH